MIKFAKRKWNVDGTKILGTVVLLLGLVKVSATQFHQLLSDEWDIIFDIAVNSIDYLFVGAGAVIIKRGYTNTKRGQDNAA